MGNHASLHVDEEDCKLLKELVYDERGVLYPEIKQATDEEYKLKCRRKEKRLAKLYKRIGKCQKYLALKKEADNAV